MLRSKKRCFFATQVFHAIWLMGVLSCTTGSSRRESDPELQTLFQLGETAYREQRYPDAVSFLEELLKRDSGDSSARMIYGLSLMGLDKLKEADIAFAKACNSAPDWPECWNNYSVLAYRQGDFQKSVSFASRALETLSYQTPHLAHSNRANALMELGKNSQALLDLEKAKSLAAKDCAVRLLLIKLHLRRPAMEKAKIEIQVAQSLCPSDPRVHLWEAYSLHQRGRLAQAQQKYSFVVSRFPRTEAMEVGIESLNNIKKGLAPEEPPL